MTEKFPQPKEGITSEEAITEDGSTPKELREKLRKLIEGLQG